MKTITFKTLDNCCFLVNRSFPVNKDKSNISYSFRWRERELTHGAWGEGSKDVQELVDVIAKSRLKHQLLDEGRPNEGSDNELALITG